MWNISFNAVVFTAFIFSFFGCGNKKKADANTPYSPAPQHDGMCQMMNLGEASDAVEAELPDNQYVNMQGMSSPKTLIWQDLKSKQIYFATKVMGAQGKLFYMEKLATGQTPTIKSSFTGTLLLWKHLPPSLLQSIKKQFKEQWAVEIDENATYILMANQKPQGCK
ncbi:MAG: hypothetical protein JXR76_19645 [Deltaproteobacteria bacterium]|nr:hypothetical protein [Deltaproteobacteria bacterium]